MRLGRMKVEATPQVSALPSTLYHFSPLCSTFTQILLHFRDKSKHFFDTFSMQRLIFRLLRAFPVPYVVINAKKHHILYKIWCSNFFHKILWKFIPFSHLSHFCHFLTHCQEFFMYFLVFIQLRMKRNRNLVPILHAYDISVYFRKDLHSRLHRLNIWLG